MSVVIGLIPLTLLGAVLGLDMVSFPQAMISRPIVAATAAGALAGNPSAGLLIGAVLELFALETLPFGASRYPEWGSASVVGGALFATQPAGAGGALVVAVLAALITAWASSWSMVQHRRLIGRWAERARPAIEAGAGDAVVSLQLRGLTADLARGGVVTAVALALFFPVMPAVLAAARISVPMSRALSISVACAVGAAAVWKAVHATKGTSWLMVAGVAIGALVVFAT
jgi:PTS system mannose-specific IIC component